MHSLILLETRHVLVVHKPPGVGFHDASGKGIVTITREHLRSSADEPDRIYPIHRLDTVTSGALLFAKSRPAAIDMINAFRNRQVAKYYVAISQRKPSKKQGSVIGDMTRGRRGSWMLQRTTVNPAITRFTSVAVTGQPPGTRAFLLKPETGRTHQLRVALKSLGSPVLGDQRYANAAEAREVDRAYLHCAALRLTVLGERLQVVCPPAHGAVFASEGFQGVWQGWFPPGMETAHGAWFEDNKLLQSSLE